MYQADETIQQILKPKNVYLLQYIAFKPDSNILVIWQFVLKLSSMLSNPVFILVKPCLISSLFYYFYFFTY